MNMFQLGYLIPQMRVDFLTNFHRFDPGRILHFPLAIGVFLNPNVMGWSFICSTVIHCLWQEIDKRFLTNMAADRAGVERVRRVIGPSVPVEERPRRHLHFPGRENAPEYLNRVSPRNGYGPGPTLVVANRLLHEPGWVQLHGPVQPLQSPHPAHVWKYGLYHVQVM